MAFPAILDNFADFLRQQSDKADLFIVEMSTQTADNIIAALNKFKEADSPKHKIMADNFRKIVSKVEASGALEPKTQGGRKKRTTRRRKHKGTK